MSDSQEQDSRPPCYGVLEEVFPLGEGGLREVSPGCWDCPQRVPCLRAATRTPQGRREITEYQGRREEEALGGVAGFLRRWSRLKSQHREGGE